VAAEVDQDVDLVVRHQFGGGVDGQGVDVPPVEPGHGTEAFGHEVGAGDVGVAEKLEAAAVVEVQYGFDEERHGMPPEIPGHVA